RAGSSTVTAYHHMAPTRKPCAAPAPDPAISRAGCPSGFASRQCPDIGFERYCDDVVVHCVSRRQAEYVREAIGGRLKECQLEMNPDKTRIVYCKDDRRQSAHQHVCYEFLGYEFRTRRVKGNDGRFFNGFNPAMSPNEAKRIHETIRSWRLGRWTI